MYLLNFFSFVSERIKGTYEKQRYDGWYNNLAHPEWGSVGKFSLCSLVCHSPLCVPSGIIFPLTMGCIPMLLSTCSRVFFYFILICPLNNVPFSFSLPKLFVYSPRLPLFLHFAFNFLRPTVFFRALRDEPRISYTTRWFRQRHLVKKIWLASPIHLPVGFEYHEFWVEAVEGWV